MILVTGATGTVGSELVKQLLEVDQKVRVLARDPAKAAKFGDKVEVLQGDLAKPETLVAAFRGVEKVFQLATGATIKELEANAIDAAKEAGAKHIVKISVQGAELDPGLELGRIHRESETKLKASGIGWTMLRPGAFASNTLAWTGSIKAQGAVFALTGEGRTAPIDPRDIAAVGVKALTSPGHQGKEYTLTGPEALSAAEQVHKISVAIGKPLKCVDVPLAAAREEMLKSGLPEATVSALMEYFALIRSGREFAITSTVEEVLGRKPHTFDEWLRDNLVAFK
jgi:(4-alkanoyl-5-oxo-2,5-dihydrofuran-3-yl)methyl phosphate reductase